MGLIGNDPWIIITLALGWQLMSMFGIFLFALILQGVGKLAGVKRKLRLRTLLISVVAFVLVVTILNMVNEVRMSWDDIVIYFLPVLTAPIIAFLGSLIWPRKETGDPSSRN